MEPVFPVEEFEMLKARYQAALTRSMSNTAMAASGALSRHVYAPDHPNYSPDPVDEMERLPGIPLDAVKEYFENRLDPTPWNVAVVGDVSWRTSKMGCRTYSVSPPNRHPLRIPGGNSVGRKRYVSISGFPIGTIWTFGLAMQWT